MKQSILYGLIGDRAGRVVQAFWNWLWGKPIETGGKIAVEVAQASLQEATIGFSTDKISCPSCCRL
ncbi:MAG: hypothetical protein ACYTXE_30540 [Nostoc sp.]